jgi:hypothetical protein
VSVYLSGYEADFCKADSAAVLFLWQNWQFYFKLHSPFISCTQISKNSWSAGSLVGGGEWYLTQQDCSEHSGLLHFHNYIHFLGRLTKVQTIFQYHRLSDGSLWYCGGGYGEMASFLAVVPVIPQYISSFLLKSIGKRGGVIASSITQDQNWLSKKAGLEAVHLYRDYLGDPWRPTENRKYFQKRELIPISIYESRNTGIISSATAEMMSQLKRLSDDLPADFDRTLLRVAINSLPLGIPGASAIAIRDFVRQNLADYIDTSKGPLRNELQAYVRRIGGRMRLTRSVGATLELEMDQLQRGVRLLNRWLTERRG